MTGESPPKRKYTREEEDAIIDKCLRAADPHASKEAQEQAVKHCLIDEMLMRRRDSPEFMEVPSPVSKPAVQGRSAGQYERETADAVRVVRQAVQELSRAEPAVKAREPVRHPAHSNAQGDEETAAALREVGRALKALSDPEMHSPARSPAEVSAEDLRKGLHCLEEAQKALSEASYLKFLDVCTTDLPPPTLTALGFTKEVAAELPVTKAAFKRAQRVLVAAARQKFREYCFSGLSPAMREVLGFTPVTATPPSGPTGMTPGSSTPTEATEVGAGIKDANWEEGTVETGAVPFDLSPGSAETRTESSGLQVPESVLAYWATQLGLKDAAARRTSAIFRLLSRQYRWLFAQGVKQACKESNRRQPCSFTRGVFERYLENPAWARQQEQNRNQPHTALRHVRGSKTNPEESDNYILHNACEQALTEVDKLRAFVGFLGEPAYQSALASYLLTGHLPGRAKGELATRWRVTPMWVRNLTFGWRRKLDAWLGTHPMFQMDGPGSAMEGTKALETELQKLLQTHAKALQAWFKKQLGKAAASDGVKNVMARLTGQRLLHLLLADEPIPVAVLPEQVNQKSKKKRVLKLRAIAETLRQFLRSILDGSMRRGLLDRHYPHRMAINFAEFEREAVGFLRSTDNILTSLNNDLKSLEVKAPSKETKAEIDQMKSRIVRLKTVQNTCKLLKERANFVKYAPLLMTILPSSRQLRTFARVCAEAIPSVGGRKRRELGVLGAILSRACLAKYWGGPAIVLADLTSVLTPADPRDFTHIITPPFCSPKRSKGNRRRKQQLPLEIGVITPSMPPLYRQFEGAYLAFEALGRALQQALARAPAGPLSFTLELPKSQAAAAWQLLEQRTVQNPKTGEFTRWLTADLRQLLLPVLTERLGTKGQPIFKQQAMEVPLTKTMRRFLRHADVTLVHGRVLPPAGPDFKIKVQLIFRAPAAVAAEAFAPALNFMGATYYQPKQKGGSVRQRKKPTNQPPHPTTLTPPAHRSLTLKAPAEEVVLGLDINRPSKHILRFATPQAVVNADAELSQVFLLSSKLKRVRQEIAGVAAALARYQARLARTVKPGKYARVQGKLKRVETELRLLHRRKAHLKETLDLECQLGGTRVLTKEQAGYLAVEDLELESRGRTGPLAIAVTDMPKRTAIPEGMIYRMNAYSARFTPPRRPAELVSVSARGTSQVCVDHQHRLKGTRDYDTQQCPGDAKTGVSPHLVDRHGNAARAIAARGRKKLGRPAIIAGT